MAQLLYEAEGEGGAIVAGLFADSDEQCGQDRSWEWGWSSGEGHCEGLTRSEYPQRDITTNLFATRAVVTDGFPIRSESGLTGLVGATTSKIVHIDCQTCPSDPAVERGWCTLNETVLTGTLTIDAIGSPLSNAAELTLDFPELQGTLSAYLCDTDQYPDNWYD